MNRITDKQLQNLIDRINEATNSPMHPYVRNDEGRMVAQIGNYHLSAAYGGVGLHRMFNEGGGIQDIAGGYMTKRELHNFLCGMLSGLEAA